MHQYMTYRFLWVAVFATACGTVQPGMSGGGGDDDDAQPQTLTVSLTGKGSVASAPAGITCGAACTAQFDLGTSVTLTATADSDSAFLGWSGDCSGAAACTVKMDAARTVTAAFAQHGSKLWVDQIGLSGQDSIEQIATDAAGNLIAAGTVTDENGSYLYVAKYARADGAKLWEQKLAGGGGVTAVAVDAAGEVYITGRLSGFGGPPFMIAGKSFTGDLFGNILVARFAAATGTPVWATMWGGNDQDIPKGIAVSGGDLYVVGETSSSPAMYDALTTTGTGGFLVRASAATGAAVLAKFLPANMQVSGIAINDTHVAVVGSHTSALMALDGRCSLAAAGNSADAMILDFLSSNLTCQWAKHFGDSGNGNTASANGIAGYLGGGWVIAGDFKGNILLAESGAFLTSRGDFDVFAGRFAADGGHIWSFRYGNTGFDLGGSVAVTADGSVVLAGTFSDSITFGPTTINGAMNAFVTRMTPGNTPTHNLAVSLGGDDYDLGSSVALAPDGTIYALGLFRGMTTVAGTALTGQDFDSWVVGLVR